MVSDVGVFFLFILSLRFFFGCDTPPPPTSPFHLLIISLCPAHMYSCWADLLFKSVILVFPQESVKNLAQIDSAAHTHLLKFEERRHTVTNTQRPWRVLGCSRAEWQSAALSLIFSSYLNLWDHSYFTFFHVCVYVCVRDRERLRVTPWLSLISL